MRVCTTLLALALVVGPGLVHAGADAELRKEAGNYYLKNRQYEAARDQYLAALQEDPDYADAHYNLGVVYFFRLQDFPRALYHFVRYAQLKPDAPDLDQVRALAGQALERIETSEREAYGKALDQGTQEALEAFIKDHPQSPYAEDANDKLRVLRARGEQVRQREEGLRKAFLDAVAAGTPEAMEVFLAEHPDSPQATEARRLRDLWADQRIADGRALEAARAEQTPEALERFVAERPNSPLADQARAEADRLRVSEEAYRIAAQARSAPALEVFLATYAGTPREAQARDLLEEVRQEEATRAAPSGTLEEGDPEWAEAEAEDTAAAYREFRARHPNHAMADEARRREAVLSTRPTQAEPGITQDAEEGGEERRAGGGEDEPTAPRGKRLSLDRYRRMLQDQ